MERCSIRLNHITKGVYARGLSIQAVPVSLTGDDSPGDDNCGLRKTLRVTTGTMIWGRVNPTQIGKDVLTKKKHSTWPCPTEMPLIENPKLRSIPHLLTRILQTRRGSKSGTFPQRSSVVEHTYQWFSVRMGIGSLEKRLFSTCRDAILVSVYPDI